MKFTTKTIHFVNYNDFDEAIINEDCVVWEN